MYASQAIWPFVNHVKEKKNISTNQTDTYYFDIEKCKSCSYKEGCYKDGAKSKTYSVTMKSDIHKDQINFEKSE